MNHENQCRMLTARGERCSFRAKEKGFCGHHSKALVNKRTAIDKLIAAGKAAAAIGSLIGAANKVVEFYPVVKTFIIGMAFKKRGLLRKGTPKVAKAPFRMPIRRGPTQKQQLLRSLRDAQRGIETNTSSRSRAAIARVELNRTFAAIEKAN